MSTTSLPPEQIVGTMLARRVNAPPGAVEGKCPHASHARGCIALAKKFVWLFPCGGFSAWLSLPSFEAILLDCIVTSKNLSKVVNFCAAILILKMEENMQHFQCIVLYYFKKGKNATKMQKKKIVQCMEKVLWLIKRVQSGLRNFALEISRWTVKWIAVKSKHSSRTINMLPRRREPTFSKYPDQ